MMVLLLSKRLSASDLSSCVLRTGRIVLPRAQMADNVQRVVAAGCLDASKALVDADAGSAQFPLEVVDDHGRTYEILLKQWTSHAAAVPKKIFVLERTSDVMRANHAVAGAYLQLREANGVLRVSVVPASAAAKTEAALVATSTPLAGRATHGVTPTKLGTCRRSPTCIKPSGHSGFCTGQQTFRHEQNYASSKTSPRHSPMQSSSSHLGNSQMLDKPSISPPQWVEVRCGAAVGHLHLPTMHVLVVNSPHMHGRALQRANKTLTLANFERLGNRDGLHTWKRSVMVLTCDEQEVPLGRWLASWNDHTSHGERLVQGDGDGNDPTHVNHSNSMGLSLDALVEAAHSAETSTGGGADTPSPRPGIFSTDDVGAGEALVTLAYGENPLHGGAAGAAFTTGAGVHAVQPVNTSSNVNLQPGLPCLQGNFGAAFSKGMDIVRPSPRQATSEFCASLVQQLSREAAEHQWQLSNDKTWLEAQARALRSLQAHSRNTAMTRLVGLITSHLAQQGHYSHPPQYVPAPPQPQWLLSHPQHPQRLH